MSLIPRRRSRHLPSVLLALLLIIPLTVRGQEPVEVPGTGGTGGTGGTPDVGGEETVEGAEILEPGAGLEAAISGTDYQLGPGDVLAITIWGPRSMAFRLAVTLEGRILIPDVGEVDVDGLLLGEGKARILEAILRHYRNVDVTITLVDLRRFQIHVLGQVRAPGTYIATAVDRVSVAVTRARGFLPGASKRQVLVENGDSLRTTADVLAFFQDADSRHNPRLRDGDKIYVPYAKDAFQVWGEVNRPGEIQFVDGDRLDDAIRLAGGFTASSFLDTLEVARYLGDAPDPFRFWVLLGGGFVPVRTADADHLPSPLDLFTPPATTLAMNRAPVYSDFRLQPNDILFVRKIPEHRHRRLVEISGEVAYPGLYPVEEGTTRLSDLVRWSGGITEDALLLDAKLLRREDVGQEDREFERLKHIPVADMREQEYQYFKMRSRETQGQMVVDFEKALRDGDPREDVLLKRGDVVVIPSRKNYVNVLGMVGRPGNVAYHPGAKFKDYIEQAGGFAEKADKGDTKVIKARGGESVSPGKVKNFEPGDVIFVPEKPQREFWPIFRDGLTVTAQILTIYLVVDRALQ